jgi:hypothetical protein
LTLGGIDSGGIRERWYMASSILGRSGKILPTKDTMLLGVRIRISMNNKGLKEEKRGSSQKYFFLTRLKRDKKN